MVWTVRAVLPTKPLEPWADPTSGPGILELGESLGDLAQPASVVSGRTLSIDIERLFQDLPNATSLVFERADGALALAPRRHFDAVMSGRLGYGRALHQRRTVEELFGDGHTLVLDADVPLSDAAAASLARDPQRRFDDVVVRMDTGVGTVTVAALFARLSHEHGHRALHDALTGLPNRELFFEELNQAQARAARSGRQLAVLFCDLDNFKSVNDRLGHAAGDELLATIATRLRGASRDADVLARLAGDEFGVLVVDASPAIAWNVAQRLLHALEEPVVVAGTSLTVQVSIGIAVGDMSTPGEALVRDADIAMYRAKRRGGGAAMYEAQLDTRTRRQMELASQLSGAVEREELELVYQPIVDLGGGPAIGCEALLRWRHPELGLVEPDHFIQAAERSGEIVKIGRWVLATACREASRWPAHEHRPAPAVAVNVSAKQAADAGFVDSVSAALESAGLEPGRLALEVTESALLEDDSMAHSALCRVADIGAEVVLDDFGTGYAALSLLTKLPLSTLKIDRTFVTGLDAEGEPRQAAHAIVRAVLGMGQALGLAVVAEGVETEDQAATLRRLGCRFAQGFMFARPMSAEALGEHWHA